MGVCTLSNVFQNLQLQRIADFIENGYAGGGSLTVDVTGAGDMQGATASTAGVHGLVPAPQAGDNEKYLTGAGTWEEPQAVGGVDYSLSEQNTGLKWIDGSNIYQKSVVFTTGAYDTYHRLQTGIMANRILKVEFYGYNTNDQYNITMCGYKNPVPMDYAIACLPNLYGGNGIIVDYRTSPESANLQDCVFTFWYTK